MHRFTNSQKKAQQNIPEIMTHNNAAVSEAAEFGAEKPSPSIWCRGRRRSGAPSEAPCSRGHLGRGWTGGGAGTRIAKVCVLYSNLHTNKYVYV